MSDSALPPSPDFMVPRVDDKCCVCGQLKRADEGSWVIDYPRWAHSSCIDWSTSAFPYDWKLKRLRTVALALRRRGSREPRTNQQGRD